MNAVNRSLIWFSESRSITISAPPAPPEPPAAEPPAADPPAVIPPKVLAPLIEACRPAAKVPPRHLRRTISAIIWRHDNGAKWRSLPEALGPWWMAAQTFIRWSRLGVWERLLSLVQERGISLGMTFLDGTSIRAHQKAAGAAKKRRPRQDGTRVRRLGAHVVAMAPRPA